MSHHISHLITSPAGERITITVIGAGGTGSLLLGTLARLNQAILRLKRIYLDVKVFDFDRVSDNNITRQLFSPSDRGQFKSRAVVERLNRFYNTQWIGIPCSWEEYPDTTRANIIITCTDTASSRIKLSRKLKGWTKTTDHPSKFAYWLDCGNTAYGGQVVLGGFGEQSNQITRKEWIDGNWSERIEQEAILPFITQRHDLRKHEKANPMPSCSLAESLAHQHIMVNDFCSKVAAMLLWDMFTKEEISWCGAYFNLETLNIKKIKC